MRKTILCSAILLLLFNGALLSKQNISSASQPDRYWFANAMQQIEKGMSKTRVQEILGPPDDIKTQNDPGGIYTYHTKEIWRYGTNGHLTFPTLGQIYIRDDDGVQYILGGQGKPPAPGTFDELELRRLLQMLNRVSTYGSSEYNPKSVIEAVNVLQPLGKERALAVIAEYLRITGLDFVFDRSRGGMFLVMRTLFEVPDPPGYMPVMRIGKWFPDPPKDQKRWPLFPLAIQDEIPFHPAQGYSLGGLAEDPAKHLEYFRANGVIRKRLLKPTEPPLKAMEKLLAAFPDEAKDERTRRGLFMQVVRMLDTVYQVEENQYGEVWIPDDQLAKTEDELNGLSIKWNAATHQYTFENGTTLAPRIRTFYRREVWTPKLEGISLTVSIERMSKSAISIGFIWQRRKPADGQSEAFLRAYSPNQPEQTLDKANLEYNAGTTSTGMTILLPEGESIALEYKNGGTIVSSAVYRP